MRVTEIPESTYEIFIERNCLTGRTKDPHKEKNAWWRKNRMHGEIRKSEKDIEKFFELKENERLRIRYVTAYAQRAVEVVITNYV